MLNFIVRYRLKHNFCNLVNRKTVSIHPLTEKLKLKIRNSQTLQINIPTFDKPLVSLRVSRAGTLADLSKQISQKLDLDQSEIEFYCNQRNKLPENTLLDILTTRYFYIYLGEINGSLPVQGQLFDYGKSEEVIQGIAGLQLPAITKRQAQGYFSRVNQWFQFYTGKSMLDQTAKLDSKTVNKIIIEAAIDPMPLQRRIRQIHRQWQRVYWIVQNLKQKKRAADQICLRRVRSKMALGLVFLTGNIVFIWTGTYLYYSWDIIQPLAYFTSLIGLIIVTAQFFKLGRPYSNVAYQQYLMQKTCPSVYKQVGFSLQQLNKAQYQLILLESKIKDYYLKRL